MAKADSDTSGAGSAAKFEAQIRAGSRPILTAEERQQAARDKAALQARWAAAKARAAAEAHQARADEYEAEASSFEKDA